MKTRRLSLAALFVAIGTMASNIIYIPAGVAKCYPVQHTINVLSAVILGPWYAGAIAFLISLLRNLLGAGSVLAFPGSMLGAVLAGLIYQKTGKRLPAAIGEVFGTGILGALVAFPVAKFILGKEVAAFAYVVPFLASTLGGSLVGYAILSKVGTRVRSKAGRFERQL
jgi:energy coupling factor transporter S component ThiW